MISEIPEVENESGMSSSPFVVQRYLSPKHSWCYSGEDFMGKIRPVMASSVRGNSMWGAVGKAFEKYLRALDMLVRDPAVWLRS